MRAAARRGRPTSPHALSRTSRRDPAGRPRASVGTCADRWEPAPVPHVIRTCAAPTPHMLRTCSA
eukprot:1534794-Pleurochrysis_carterae.AAC.1